MEESGVDSKRSYMGGSINGGTSKSSIILVGFSLMNHPFWGTPIYGNPHMKLCLIDYEIAGKLIRDMDLW